MALQKVGKFYYGDFQSDIKDELLRYSKKNSYPTIHYADTVCLCGKNNFGLLVDENEGVAIRLCNNCKTEHPIGDSREFLDNSQLEECECVCGKNIFEITVGVALYQESTDVRWVYIGCRCINCKLTACYADWKADSKNYEEFLAKV